MKIRFDARKSSTTIVRERSVVPDFIAKPVSSVSASRNFLFTTDTDRSGPADLAACRTRKAGFNAAQGDFCDAPQVCPRCPIDSLNAKACHERRQVTGKVCGMDLCGKFAFRLRLL